MLVIAFATFGALILFATTALAQNNVSSDKTINFSARLRGADGATAPDGSYNVSFLLYNSRSSGSPIWSETYYDTNGDAAGEDFRVKVVNGYLNVRLGSRTPFGDKVNWDGDLWLTMNIGGTSQTGSIEQIPWDGEMSPRIELGAVPYAMNAGALGGRTADDFIQLGQGTQTASGDNPIISINTTGKGDLIQLQRNAEDVFTVDSEGNITFGGSANHTISVASSEPGTDGRTLTITGGDSGGGDANGGNLVLTGGSGSGDGANGLVVLTTTAFATATDDANCYAKGMLVESSCTVAQTTIDNSSAAMIGFSTPDQVATLPDPTLATPGRILYIMAANNSLPFTLRMNGTDSVSMQPKAAQTLLWNGNDWVVAGNTGSGSGFKEPELIVENTDKPVDIAVESGDAAPIEVQDKEPTNNPSTGDSANNPDADDEGPFRLDNLDEAPAALPGSMYYDTNLGKVQCYEEEGWGACGDAPDTFVTISPEYTNAVMNGTDIGIIHSDFCSGTLGINDGSELQPRICDTDETYNFYGWTSDENEEQTRSIYLTYQLPDNFKNFVAGSTSIMGRTDSDDASVSYQVYRDNGSGLISCGDTVDVSSGLQSRWQRGTPTEESDPTECEFEAGDSILFRINLTAQRSANAYVSNVHFIFRNN